ncbi:MAG: hypothetical protein GY749_08055 [Desulfobacteraceae bacterium]|nr:hypothetical protein [Desulfobacteraceae bacterium]
MNQIIPFHYEENEVRVVQENGNHWWVAADVCAVLDLKNPREAITHLDDDEKNTVRISDGNRGNPNVNIISESGLYCLIIRSNKPEAKKFRKWITSEVLPAIRKTGAYTVEVEDLMYNPAEELLMELAERVDRLEKQISLPEASRRGNLHNTVKVLEIRLIKKAMGETRNNKAKASRLLGISRQGLDKKIKRYSLADSIQEDDFIEIGCDVYLCSP